MAWAIEHWLGRKTKVFFTWQIQATIAHVQSTLAVSHTVTWPIDPKLGILLPYNGKKGWNAAPPESKLFRRAKMSPTKNGLLCPVVICKYGNIGIIRKITFHSFVWRQYLCITMALNASKLAIFFFLCIDIAQTSMSVEEKSREINLWFHGLFPPLFMHMALRRHWGKKG